MADLLTVSLFFENADSYAVFKKRVAAALVDTALTLREEAPPVPVTEVWRARQSWANNVLSGKDAAMAAAGRMLPALAVIANDAGLIDENGEIDATDAQIESTIDTDLVDAHAGYIPDAG